MGASDMNFCNYCYTRMDACETCKDAIIAEKDKEIAALKDTITSLRVHLAVIREYVKDKVRFALEESEK